MPSDKEFQELRALVERIAESPKVKPYLDGGQWPRRVMMGEGTVSSGEQDKVAWEQDHPKSKALVAAEEAVAATQAEFDVAQRAWIDASTVEKGGQYMHKDGFGGAVVVDVPPDALIQGRKDVPEFQAFDVAERKMIAARVRLYKAQRERDLDRVRWEQKRNPSPNPSKDEDRSWSKRIRMGPFGGEKRPASGLGKR